MKETVTIYVCKCGSESDNTWTASVHFVKCRERWSEKELTPDEYIAWQQVYTTGEKG